MKQIPQLSADLIKLLDEQTPQVTWRKGDTLEDVAYRQGQRNLIEMLKSSLERAERNIMRT